MSALPILALMLAPNVAADASREAAIGECQAVDANEIIVCGNRKRDERYRMPGRNGPFDPAGDMKSVMNERATWAAEGDTGVQSCGAVGPGGWTGCTVKRQKQNRDQYQWGKNVPKRR